MPVALHAQALDGVALEAVLVLDQFSRNMFRDSALAFANDQMALVLAQEADKQGYAVVWAAEAYGSDSATVLSWIAAQTSTIDIGSAVFQIPARTPAMTAMTAATLDTLMIEAFGRPFMCGTA